MPEFPHTGPPRKTHVMNHNMKCGTISSAKKQKGFIQNSVYLGYGHPFPSNSEHQDFYMFSRESR